MYRNSHEVRINTLMKENTLRWKIDYNFVKAKK